MSLFDIFKRKQEPNILPSTIETIQRQMTILNESVELVNSSNDLNTVLHRFDTVLKCLEILQKYSAEEFNAAGYYLTGSLALNAEIIIGQKNQLINQAIERDIRSKIKPLRTTTGKINKLEDLYDNMRRIPMLTPENLGFLHELYITIQNELLKNGKTTISLKNENSDDISFEVRANHDHAASSYVKVSRNNISEKFEMEMDYVEISTSGDDNVCQMCAQFDGKIFSFHDAPKLPLCPNCACDYKYYSKEDLPFNATISNIDDFTLPADCTNTFYEIQHQVFEEKDIEKRIILCQRQLSQLKDFMQPYISANFHAPAELACRDLLPDLYMQIGEWEKAKETIKDCIEAKAYLPDDGGEDLSYLELYHKVALETLSFISKNPGYLQRNIYKAMGYMNEEKECLKNFLRSSKLIRKVKNGNTNELYCSQ